MTTRHETLADAFEASITAGGLIYGYGFWGRSEYTNTEFYVVPFASVEWAEKCGMRLVDDFSALL